MLFTDPFFLFYFLPAVLALHWLANRASAGRAYGNWARLCLFLSTLIFYGYSHAWWLAPFFVSIAFDFIWASALQRTQSPALRTLLLFASLTQNLSLLGLFKYWSFFKRLLAHVKPEWAVALPDLTENGAELPLPAGISFYTFESLSFVIDVYRREVTPPKNPLEFFAFIAMFPRFIAGPIVRYKDMVAQFAEYRGMQLEPGLLLFSLGLFLKCAFADSFGAFVPYAFDKFGEVSFVSAWLGVLAYTMQIYFDFSGYSLMAIGIGRCFGFRFPDNFRQPYLASSLQDFWRRWHISLSTWLRDYLYVPMGGSRKGSARTYLHLIITMGLGGLWHGASVNFVIWGLWHGGFLALERLFRLSDWLPKSLHSVLTFFVVLFGWIFFRAKYYTEAFSLIRVMFNPWATHLSASPEPLQIYSLSTSLCLLGLAYCFIWERRFLKYEIEAWVTIAWGKVVGAAMLVFALLYSFSAGQIPFLYFQF